MAELSESFVASIARALNSAQIPCVLWGHYLLVVHGVPSIVASIDFVIPDHDIDTGAKVLSRLARLTPCHDTEVCIFSHSERPTPPPSRHFHIESSDIVVGLYLQSETLWFLPPLDRSLASPSHVKLQLPSSPFVLASDQTVLPPWRPGRGAGVFKPGQPPVVVPRSHVLLEAFLRLYARDLGRWMGAFAMAMIGYVELYIDEDGLLDAGRLPEPLRTFYRDLRHGNKPVRQWGLDLQEALGVPRYKPEPGPGSGAV